MKQYLREFPGGQWLGFRAFTARAQVPALVSELKSCKPCSVANKKKERKKKLYHRFDVLLKQS